MAMKQVAELDPAHGVADLYLAASLLATGHHLAGTTREGARVRFHFSGGPDVDHTVMSYTNGTLQVDACRFIHALDRLRSLVAHTRT
jgi:hypothetical protein